MKNKVACAILCAVSLTITVSCEKEDQEHLTQKTVFVAPNVASAKAYYDAQSQNQQVLSKSTSAVQDKFTDWENTSVKPYKQTNETVVDILYTPFYVHTSRNAKGFLATTELNGTIDAREIYILYKDDHTGSNFSAFVLIYTLEGTLQFAYNFENGEEVPLPQSDSGLMGKNSELDCYGNIETMNNGEFLLWLYFCSDLPGSLQAATVFSNPTGFNGGSTTAFNAWNADLSNPSTYIPAGGGNLNGWGTSNVVAPLANELGKAMGLNFNTPDAQWLLQQQMNDAGILATIAAYLNANKAKPQSHGLDAGDFNDNQFPGISPIAIAFILDLIGYMRDNPEVDNSYIENAIASTGLQLDCALTGKGTEVCECVAEGGTIEQCVMEELTENLYSDMDKECQASILGNFMNIDSNIINNVTNIFFGNNDYNLRILDVDLPIELNALASTVPPDGMVLNENTVIDIRFDNSYLENATDLSIALSAAHEFIHVNFIYLFIEGTLLTNYPDYVDMNTAFENFEIDHTPLNAQILQNEMHNVYDDFIDDMSNAVYLFAQATNIENLTLDYSRKFVIGHHQNTDSFQNLTSEEQTEYSTIAQNEQNGDTNAKGSKCNQ
jgi:hypothetical protein